MSWIDWLIVLFPLGIVGIIGFKCQKYVKGVADFLSAGRVAGRYVVAVSSGEAAMGLVSLVAMFEAYYNSGLAYSFWGTLKAPIGIVLLLTGFAIYRFRESRAMTMGQFFELRYNRSFRIMAGIMQSISGVLNYAIFPAVGARFLVYFCDLPIHIEIFGFAFPTYMLVMAVFLSVAVFVATMGGQITIMVTDCIQGILSYPMYAIIVVYILMHYSWFDDIAPALLNRPPGKSMLNPFDIAKLRNFNLFYVFVGIFSNVFNRMAWSGTQGYNSAAANAHEQKMGAVLGVWRTGFSRMMYILLAVVAFAVLNNGKFFHNANLARTGLTQKVASDIAGDPKYKAVRKEIDHYLQTDELTPAAQARIAEVKHKDKDIKNKIQARKKKWGIKDENTKSRPIPPTETDTTFAIAKTLVRSEDEKQGQAFGTIFKQMRIPMTLKTILPIGITGVFCALCIFLLISTDTTYLHSWGSIIVQDIILPIRGKPFTPRLQLLLLRILIALVALFAFLFSSFFAQVDFILMFFAITGAIWLGGAGPCIIGGLYWKRGTSGGAFAALICGSTLAVLGIVVQQTWVDHIVPWMEVNNRIGTAAIIFETASRPFEPYIQWRMNLEKFPINSQEIYFFAMVLSLTLYVVVSLLTCRKPFNMDRLLHRGKYRREGNEVTREKLTFRSAIKRLVGIDSQYTRGDKALAWSVFIWSLCWGFGSFLVAVVWNLIRPWPNDWWSFWYFLNYVVIAGIVGVVSTVWFTIGGVWDLNRLFKRLKAKKASVLDDGRVIDNVSADDVALVEKVDHVKFEEAHREEKILREELIEEHDLEDLESLDDQTEANE